MPYRSAQATQGAPVREQAPRRLDEPTQRAILAGGGVLGALAMSSCCLVPLALFGLGITGAWIGNLAALYPYKPYFFAATAVFLGLGFHRVYRKPRAAVCNPDGQCRTPSSMRLTKTALWLSTVLVLTALAFPYAAPVLLDV